MFIDQENIIYFFFLADDWGSWWRQTKTSKWNNCCDRCRTWKWTNLCNKNFWSFCFVASKRCPSILSTQLYVIFHYFSKIGSGKRFIVRFLFANGAQVTCINDSQTRCYWWWHFCKWKCANLLKYRWRDVVLRSYIV